jgi:hypothetical protein
MSLTICCETPNLVLHLVLCCESLYFLLCFFSFEVLISLLNRYIHLAFKRNCYQFSFFKLCSGLFPRIQNFLSIAQFLLYVMSWYFAPTFPFYLWQLCWHFFTGNYCPERVLGISYYDNSGFLLKPMENY